MALVSRGTAPPQRVIPKRGKRIQGDGWAIRRQAAAGTPSGVSLPASSPRQPVQGDAPGWCRPTRADESPSAVPQNGWGPFPLQVVVSRSVELHSSDRQPSPDGANNH